MKLNPLVWSVLLFACLQLVNTVTNAEEATLTVQLQKLADASKSKGSSEKRKIMTDAIEALRKSQITDRALKVGDRMPDFVLPDVKNGPVDSKKLLKKGMLVIVFYRGGWCPYCNLQLHDLQAHLSEIKALGANLVAISPQTPDNSLSTAQKDGLSFYVLSDVDSKVAKQFNLTYTLPDNLKKLYREFGIDLEKSNASKVWELPLGATYIILPNNKIAYAFLNVDYKKRAETLDIIQKLKVLSTK